MRTRFLAALVVGALLLAAWPALPQSAAPTPTPSLSLGHDPVRATLHAAYAQPTPTATPAPSQLQRLLLAVQAWVQRQAATETPPCAWMWASQPLADLTARVQTAIEATGAEGVTFDASAYGESCLEADGQTARSFIPGDVVFRLRVAGADPTALGAALARALPVVQVAVQAESRPLAEIGILFPDADLDPVRLTPTMLDRVLAQEASGAALVARLYAVALR